MKETQLMTELRAFFLSKYDSDENLRKCLLEYHKSKPYKSCSRYVGRDLSDNDLKRLISDNSDFFKTVAKHVLKSLEYDNPEEYLEDLNNYSQKPQKPLIRYYLSSLIEEEEQEPISFDSSLADVLSGKGPAFQKRMSGKNSHLSNNITIVYRWDNTEKFIGRKSELILLHRKLEKGKFVAVHGMKGIGKTSLVQAYITKYRSGYDNLVWIPVTSGIENSLAITFQGLNSGVLAKTPFAGNAQFTDVILKYLNDIPGKNLLIIDGANDRYELKQFVNKLEHNGWQWKTICTSFINPKIHDEIELNELKPNDAFELFLVYYNEDREENDKVKNEILLKKYRKEILGMLKEVNYHTLLTELFAKMSCEDELMSIEHLLQLVKGPESLKEARFDFPVQPNILDPLANRIQAVDMTPYNYILALFRADLERLHPEESMILMYFSVLPTKPIRRCDLQLLFCMDEDKFMALLARTKGWIKYDRETDTFRMVELYQFVVREILRPDAGSCSILIGQVIARLNDPELEKNNAIMSEYTEFAENLISHFNVNIRDINPEDDDSLRSVLIDNIYSFAGVNDCSISPINAELFICVARKKFRKEAFAECFQVSLKAALMLLSLKMETSRLFYESLILIADSLKVSNINSDAADEIYDFVEKKNDVLMNRISERNIVTKQ